MATALAIPLDEWVCASARPARVDILEKSRESTTRHNYSNLSVEDAFPLLVRACKTRFGNLTALEFNVKQSQGPLVYSAALTITGPDEIGIEFPGSGSHPTLVQAKMHAAHRAIQSGAIEFIMHNEASAPTGPKQPAPPASAIAAPSLAREKPKIGNANQPKAASAPNTKQPDKAGSKKGQPQHPLNVINIHLQRVYRDHKLKMPKTSQEWETVQRGPEVGARLTIRLPSGQSRWYGTVLEKMEDPSQHPKMYPSLKDAKLLVATEAVKAGALEFIKSEELNAQPAPPRPIPTLVRGQQSTQDRSSLNLGAPLPSHAALSNYVAFDPQVAKPSTSKPIPLRAAGAGQKSLPSWLPPKPSFLPALPIPASTSSLKPSTSGRPQSGQASIGTTSVKPTNTRREPPPHLDSPPKSPVDEVEAVDELLGPATNSKPSSVGTRAPENISEEEGEVKSREDENAHSDDGKSESMDLDSDTEPPPPPRLGAPPVVPDSEATPPPNASHDVEQDTRPQKRQKTAPPASPIPDGGGEATSKENTRVMQGTSYSNILSEFCLETGRAQPQVIYQRNIDDSSSAGSEMYHVAVIVGTGRYELSKNYESVQIAEEKLSKRILRVFGVRAKKVSSS